jgi:hypothetical protein
MEDFSVSEVAMCLPGGYVDENGAIQVYDGWTNTHTLKGRLINADISNPGMTLRKTNFINIGNAVDTEGKAVHLPGIDFIKVQNIAIEYNEKKLLQGDKRVSGIKNNHI